MFKVGNLVEFKDDGGYDVGVVVHVDATWIKIVWFDYEGKQYHYRHDENSLKGFVVIA